jgi:hypothetical protein
MKDQTKQNIRSNWFTKFPIGSDAPGERHFRDAVEENGPIADGWKVEDVLYKFNNWCYRGQLVPMPEFNAAFGCSCTFGTGVNQPWPEQLGVVNCGQPGASNDKIARLAIAYCNTFNPQKIYVMWTFAQRREWINEKGYVLAYKNQTIDNTKEWLYSHATLMNDVWDEYNYDKNQLLLRSYCKLNNIELAETHVTELPKINYAPARDNTHPGPDWHLNVTANFLT